VINMRQYQTSYINLAKRISLGLIPIAILTSCAALTATTAPPAYKVITPGATLTLTRELTIPPGQAGLIIQGDQIGNNNDINAWYPHCRIELRTVSDTPQTVLADTFTVQRVTRETDYVLSSRIMFSLNSEHLPTRSTDQQQHSLAVSPALTVSNKGTSSHTATMFGNDGGPMAEIYRTYLYVKSSTQPDVVRFMCEYWEDPTDGAHLSVEQIQQALGNIVLINLLRR